MNARELLLYETRQAFREDDEMSLQAALHGLTQHEASWKPTAKTPPIEGILHHIAWVKVRYCKQAFGPCDLEDDVPTGDLARTLDWLQRAHKHLEKCLADVPLDALDRPVPTDYHGASAAHLFWVFMMHDLSHAGQIQIIRRLYGREHKGR